MMDKAKKIKSDLEKRFPRAKFSVKVKRGDEVWVDRVSGHDYADEFPTYRKAVQEMVRVVRQTIPNFEWEDYTTNDGKVVYHK
jgi:hypothetical protein